MMLRLCEASRIQATVITCENKHINRKPVICLAAHTILGALDKIKFDILVCIWTLLRHSSLHILY